MPVEMCVEMLLELKSLKCVEMWKCVVIPWHVGLDAVICVEIFVLSNVLNALEMLEIVSITVEVCLSVKFYKNVFEMGVTPIIFLFFAQIL